MGHLETYFHDCLHIQALAAELGYKITLEEARAIWESHSEDYAANWLVMESDTDIKAVIEYHMPIHKKVCPHCGQRLEKSKDD